MKKIRNALLECLMVALTLSVYAETEEVGGYEWSYHIGVNGAVIYKGIRYSCA